MFRKCTLPVAAALVCLLATTANAQMYYFGGGYYPRRDIGGWGPYANAPYYRGAGYYPGRAPVAWGGYSNVVFAPVAAPAAAGGGGCIGQTSFGLATLGLVQTPAYSYVPITTQGGCSGNGPAAGNLQQFNTTLTSINNTLTTMNNTLTSIDTRLQTIQTDVAKLSRDAIKIAPPKPEPVREKIPAPAPKLQSPGSASLSPQKSEFRVPPTSIAAAGNQLDQATEHHRIAKVELHALLRQIKPERAKATAPSPGRANETAGGMNAMRAEKIVASD
jgi:hypothetical protein